MLGAIEETMNHQRTKGIFWTAKTLTDRGRNAEESTFGADFMGVLKIELPGFSVTKGFLGQAKLLRPDRALNLEELKGQCHKMLKYSPDSFVFFYRENGIRVVPAISVVSTSVDPWYLYSRSGERFFEEHLKCFIGDGNIQTADAATLEQLRIRYNARSALFLKGVDSG